MLPHSLECGASNYRLDATAHDGGGGGGGGGSRESCSSGLAPLVSRLPSLAHNVLPRHVRPVRRQQPRAKVFRVAVRHPRGRRPVLLPAAALPPARPLAVACKGRRCVRRGGEVAVLGSRFAELAKIPRLRPVVPLVASSPADGDVK